MILTDEERQEIFDTHIGGSYRGLMERIEAAVLDKIMARGAVAWLDAKGYAWTQIVDGIENQTPLYSLDFGKDE
jgi:hypothetical protein